jgi:hypothetical protein
MLLVRAGVVLFALLVTLRVRVVDPGRVARFESRGSHDIQCQVSGDGDELLYRCTRS